MPLAVEGTDFTVKFINLNIHWRTSQKHYSYYYTKSKVLFLYTLQNVNI